MKKDRNIEKLPVKANKIKKRKFLLIILVATAALGMLFALTVILPKLSSFIVNPQSAKDVTDMPDRTAFFPEDYEEDISKDELYMKKNRLIRYTANGFSVTINNSDYSDLGSGAVFFKQYFDILINGESDKYSSLFDESYLSKTDAYDKRAIDKKIFTKQKIFDIDVEQLSETLSEENGENIKAGVYVVRYKIFQNNGSFRGDLHEDTYLPLVFETITRNGKTLITDVYQYYAD